VQFVEVAFADPNLVADPDNTTVAFPSSFDWENMLAEFRALGGVADNVAPAPDRSGRGLFPRNPDKPFLLRMPDNLLFPDNDVEFVDQQIRIRNDASIGAAERAFFERYQNAFSWGAGGRAEGARLVEQFESLPAELSAILVTDFGMSRLIDGDRAERISRYFLRSRTIRWNSENVLMPLIDLINFRSDGMRLSSDPEGHVQIEGDARGEILVAHGLHDSLGTFNKFGFASARPHAYSLPMRTKVGTSELAIGRNVMANARRDGFAIPEMRSEGTGLHLSYLMIGHPRSPRLSRGIFDALMREANTSGAQAAFDTILLVNRTKFLRLLETLEPHDGELIRQLRMMAYFQLEAMTHCVGSREL